MPQNVKNFRLLAIKPLEGCKVKYRKNLQENVLYRFYKDYEFYPDSGPITEIKTSGKPYEIFNDFVAEDRKLKINIAAVVGKNGSGKSTLVELFYLCAYLVANTNRLLPVNEHSPSGQRQAIELSEIKNGLKIEVYYQIGNDYHCIIIDKDYGQNPRENLSVNVQFHDLFGNDKMPLKDFFYTIAVNYSIYGLNESLVGPWLGRLFHKNDGYQTPIVLNPFRDKGAININAEMLFAQTRLLSNIRFDQNGINEILPGKSIKEIRFTINKQKLTRLEGHSTTRIFEELEKSLQGDKYHIFTLVYTAMLEETPDFDSIERIDWREMTIDYVLGKIIRIAKNYPEYNQFYTEKQEEQIPGITDIQLFVDKLKSDLTHVTLKLRQALNFFRNDPLRLNDERIRRSQSAITIQSDLFAERYLSNCEKYPDRDPMEFIPLAPFSPKIILSDASDFHLMSSGEQQFVHTVQSILYHILNVDSVFNYKGEKKRETYPFINIIMDEIELYFHPEYQRRFVSEILKRISELKAPKIKSVNLLFLTHSPFILSDIPAANVLHLEKGNIIQEDSKTFAANIHQMLSGSFFMASTTGDYARIQLENIIKFYQRVRSAETAAATGPTESPKTRAIDQQNSATIEQLKTEYIQLRPKFQFVISQVGEPVISGVLKNHIDFMDNKFEIDTREELSAERQRLQEQLKAIDKQLNSRQ